MTFLTAQEAREIVNFVSEHDGAAVIGNLKSGLERIKESALAGDRSVVFQGYGHLVDLDALKIGFEKLGYSVEDVSGKITKGSGGPWMDRSLLVSW